VLHRGTDEASPRDIHGYSAARCQPLTGTFASPSDAKVGTEPLSVQRGNPPSTSSQASFA
jgi:hypothetical protein